VDLVVELQPVHPRVGTGHGGRAYLYRAEGPCAPPTLAQFAAGGVRVRM
jgi:hypothetical protein